MAFDIIGLAKNKRGRDFIIADLHGMNECLESVIKQLGLREGDRLFLAGDLVDRGKDSLGVIETILKSDIEIHAVKGNHEKMTLDSIRALERIVAHRGGNFDLDEEELRTLLPQLIADESIPKETRELIVELQNHINRLNGGIWIVELFFKEFTKGKIKFNEGGKIDYEVDSKVKMIYDYMDDLPYIISVQGDEKVAPFNMVHADMPIDDLELKRRLNEELREEENYAMLTPQERMYAMYVRKAGFDSSIGRTPFSVLTYCGHTIIGKEEGDCLRRDTSTVDLDRGAYLTNISIVVNHTLRKVLTASSVKNPPHEGQVKGAKQTALEIKNYLSEKTYSERLRRMMQDIVKKMSEAASEEVTKIFSDGLQAINIDIQSSNYFSKIKQWDPIDFLRYAHADTEIDDETMLKINKQVVVSIIESVKDDPETLEKEESIRLHINIIAEFYNAYRQPAEPLQYDAMLDRLFPEKKQPVVSEKGLFAAQDKTGEEKREALQREVREEKAKFINKKRDEYLYQPGVLDLDVSVKDVAKFIAELNAKIKLHDDAYPRFAIYYLSYTDFYKEIEDKLYWDLSVDKRAFIKSSLEVEEVKCQLSQQVAKCTSAEEVDEMVRDTYVIIDDIIHTHNGKFEPIINPISLAELKEYAKPGAAAPSL